MSSSFALHTGVAAALLLLVAGCGPAEEKPAASPTEIQPASLDAPRNTWLTAATLLPLDADGKVVRDTDRRPYGYELIGEEAPVFGAPLVGGGEITRESLRGKWTVVDFWGIWCGDCRRDQPFVKELAAKLEADPDIDFLSVHTPPNRARADEAFGAFESVEAYFESQGGGYITAIDHDASLREAFRIAWTPSYLLVAPDLRIVAFRTDLGTGGEGSVDKAINEIRSLRSGLALR